jgi:hypothetical protein
LGLELRGAAKFDSARGQPGEPWYEALERPFGEGAIEVSYRLRWRRGLRLA